MINSVTSKPVVQKSQSRYKNIKYSGYGALAGVGVCALTGFRQIKIPHKAKLHKFSAAFTAVAALCHLGTIKHWDKILSSE